MYAGLPDAYFNLLRTHHRVTSEVYILNNARQYLLNATDRLVSGVVDMDAEAKVSRFGKMSLLDPGNDLNIGTEGYGSQYYNRMVYIVYRVTSMDYAQSYAVPVFLGPITYAEREGVTLKIQFEGMEVLLQDGLLNPYNTPAYWPRSLAIMVAIQQTIGESTFQDFAGGARGILKQPWSIDAGENLWARLKELADSMACNLYWDGRGVCKIMPKDVSSNFLLDSTWFTEDPTPSYDVKRLKNVTRVTGATGPVPVNGEMVRMFYEAWPPPQHPFSPQTLARNGVARVIPQLISDESLKDWGEIIETAWNNLGWNLILFNEVNATICAAPFLEEFDVIQIVHPRLVTQTVVNKWTLPLVGDAEMSFNSFSSTSGGNARGAGSRVVSNKGQFQERLRNHGPSGAFDPIRNSIWGNPNGGKKYDATPIKGSSLADALGGGKNGGKKKNKGKNKNRGNR